MDMDLLSQFIFQARKNKKTVKIITESTIFTIEPWMNTDFKNNTLITREFMINLNSITAVEETEPQKIPTSIKELERMGGEY